MNKISDYIAEAIIQYLRIQLDKHDVIYIGNNLNKFLNSDKIDRIIEKTIKNNLPFIAV